MLRISDTQLQKINRAYRNDTNRVYRPAVLGDTDGTIPDPQLPGNVIVRIPGANGLSVGRSVTLGEDMDMPYEPGIPVRLGRDRQRRDSVQGLDNRGLMAAGVNPVAIFQRQQSGSTTPGDMEELRCVQSSPPSLTVSLKSWNPRVNGIYYLFGGADIDLTAAVPSTGNMLYAVVAVTSDYATLEYAVSTARSEADVPLGVDDINEAVALLAGSSTPAWAIKLVGDQTEITQAGIDDDGQDLRNMVNVAEGGGSVTQDYILLRDEQSNTTEGGTFTSGAWQTRPLNTISVDTTGVVTLSSNQFALPSGTYRIRASAPAFSVNGHQLRLQNITDTTTVAYGSNAYSRGAALAQAHAFLDYRFTIAGTKTFELQHRCASTVSTNGFGAAMSFGNIEVYAVVELIKE